jgi:hypothetical protein
MAVKSFEAASMSCKAAALPIAFHTALLCCPFLPPVKVLKRICQSALSMMTEVIASEVIASGVRGEGGGKD